MDRMRNNKKLTFQNELQHIHSNLTIGYLNIRSLKLHYDDLQKDDTHKSCDAFCISECRMKDYDAINLENFKTFYTNSQHGLAMYYNNKYAAFQQNLSKTIIVESICILLNNVIIIGVYIPPKSPWSIVNKDINIIFKDIVQLKTITSEITSTIICGDFNMDLNLNSNDKLINLFRQNSYQQLVQTSTHTLGGILDLFFVNNLNNTQIQQHFVYYSDHQWILATSS